MKSNPSKSDLRVRQVFKEIIKSGPLSLAELARRLRVSIPVMTSTMNTLRDLGWVLDKREDSQTAGRPPMLFGFRGDAAYVIGADLGRMYSNLLILDLNMTVVAERLLDDFPLANHDEYIDSLLKKMQDFALDSKIPWDKIVGAGFSIPGIVRGSIGASETYLSFGGRPVIDIIASRMGKPVCIENDAKAMALGESWFGGARELTNVLCLDYGWGLGLGIIADGNLYAGKNGLAGEFGHIPINPDGPLCYCGKRGCLEMMSSGQAMARLARERLQNGSTSIISSQQQELESIDPHAIIRAAERGDQFSIEILEEAGRYLGLGIGMLINIFNPEKVIIGGDISRIADYLLDSIRSHAMKHSLVQLNREVQFEISTLSENAAAMGMGRRILSQLIEQDLLVGKYTVGLPGLN